MKRSFSLGSFAVVLLFILGAVAGTPGFAQASNPARELQNTFIAVATALKPSVVNIRVEKTEEHPQMQGNMPFEWDDEENPFGDFFHKFFQTPQGPKAPKGPKGKKFRIPKNGFKPKRLPWPTCGLSGTTCSSKPKTMRLFTRNNWK